MNDSQPTQPPSKPPQTVSDSRDVEAGAEETFEFPACPVCGGHLIDIRQKRVCERCHTICETCCEGGRG